MLLNGCIVNALATHFKIFKMILSVYSCFFEKVQIFQLFLSTGKWDGRGSRADTKGNIIPQRICATSHHEWSIEKHNIED